MPVPLIGAAIGVGVGLASAPLFSVQSSYVGPLLEPGHRGRIQNANSDHPNVPPDLHQLFEIYYRGNCSRDELDQAALLHGAWIKGGRADRPFGVLWSQYVDSVRPRIPLDVAMRAAALGAIPAGQVGETIRYLGYRYSDDRDVIAKDSRPLDADDLLALWWRGDIDNAELERYLRHAGYRNLDIQALLKRTRRGPSGIELLGLLNRGQIDDAEARKYMKWAGVTGEVEQDRFLSLRYALPSSTEVGIMATRHVFNDAYVAKFGLDADMPDQYKLITSQLGFNWRPSPNGPLPDDGSNQTVLKRLWQAHWRTLDVGTAVEMLRRLRPTGGIGGGPRVPGVPVFTAEDFTDILASNEVIPGFRDQIRAVSYAIPSRLYVKRLYASGIVSRDEVKETLKDQGYDDVRSEQMTQLVVHETQQARINKLRPITLTAVKQAYKLGTISRIDASKYLYLIYLDNFEEQAKYLEPGPGGLKPFEVDVPWVNLALATIDGEIKAELASKAIDVIRKAYLRQEVTASTARDQLIGLGILYNRALQYVQLWSYELAAEGAEVSAARLVDWYVHQLMDQATLAERLSRLHYTPIDAQLIIASANLRLSEERIKLAAKVQKAGQQEVKSLAAAAKALQLQQLQLQKHMCKSATKTQLASWAAKGLISTDAAKARLVACGMDSIDADRLLAAAVKKKVVPSAKEISPQDSGGTTPNTPAVASTAADTTANIGSPR